MEEKGASLFQKKPHFGVDCSKDTVGRQCDQPKLIPATFLNALRGSTIKPLRPPSQ
jgi:hypothetical protein